MKFGIGPDASAVPSSYGGFALLAHPASDRVIHSSYYGAFEVRGAIKAVYENNGSQAGPLGFPMSDEYNDPVTGYRRSDFQGGYIVYDSSIGGYRSYIKNDVQVLEPTQRVLQSMRTFEALCLQLYDDDTGGCYTNPSGNGNCTFGYGHKVHDGPCDGRANEQEFIGLNQQEAQQKANDYFTTDVRDEAVNPIKAKVSVPVNQHQFDALVHYTFNAGREAGIDELLERSQLNAKGYDKVPGTLIITRPTQDGEYLPGLGNRREKEAFIFAESKY